MSQVELIMPKMGESVHEATIIKWLKNEGDRVEPGDTLANVESEKLEFPVESPVSGVLKRVLARAGEVVPVAQPIAVIETE